MRFWFAVSSLILAVVGSQTVQAATGDPVRIVITGGALAAPITITDPTVTGRFKVGEGPGTFELRSDGSRLTSNQPAMIVEWPAGMVSPPSGSPPLYEVSFVIPRRGTYYVYYAIDPATKRGCVYFPGRGEPHYESNVRMIYRQVEGHWFHAWSAWEEIANPLISQALAAR